MNLTDFVSKIEADAVTEIEVKDVDFGYNTSTYSKKVKYDVVVDKNAGTITLTTEDTDGEEPNTPPLKDGERELISSETVDSDYNYGYYNNGHYADDYPREYSYTYRLTDEEYEQLDNQNKFEELSKLKDKLYNPNLPDWSVFRPRGVGSYEVHKAETDITTANHTLNQFDHKIKLKEDALSRVEKLASATSDIDEGIKELNKARGELKEIISKTDNETIKDSLNNELRIFDIREQNLIKSKENYEKKSSSAFVNKNLNAIEKLKEDKAAFEKKLDESKKIVFENFISSRYPDSNGNTSNAAAREWIKNHPDAYKTIDRDFIING